MRKLIINNVQCTIKLILLLFTFYILHSTFYIPPVFAQADSIGQSRINPASPLYFLKSIREILELKFAGTTHVRALRELEFATRRIREVKSLGLSSRQDLIEPTLSRYLFHLNELIGIINLKDDSMVGGVTDAAAAHMNVLQAIYPQVSDQRARRSIRAIINSLSLWDQRLIERLNEPQPLFAQRVLSSKLLGCRFLSQEASSSALNDVERAVFAQRAQTCFR